MRIITVSRLRATNSLELGLDYSSTESKPLLKTLSVRLDEVKAQPHAVRRGALPRDGVSCGVVANFFDYEWGMCLRWVNFD